MPTKHFVCSLGWVAALLLSLAIYGTSSTDDTKPKTGEKTKADLDKAKADKDAEKAEKNKEKVEANKAKFDLDRNTRLKDAGVVFNKNVDTSKKFIVSEFDHSINRIKLAPGLTAAARKDKMDDWTKAKKLFEESNKFPDDDEFAELELKYYVSVNKAFMPIAAIINQNIELGNQSKNTKMAEEGMELKSKLEKQMLGTNNFNANSKWHGTLLRGKDTIPYHLNIGRKTESGTFKGHVEDNPGIAGNWAYDVEGQTSGLGVNFALTKSVRGKFQAVQVLGVVSGDRLIAEVSQTTGGKVTKGLIVLHRR